VLDDDLLDVSPSKKAGRRSMFARHVAHGIAWGVLLATLILGVPTIEPIFTDFGVPLPNLTTWVIQASHWPSALLLLTVLLLVADRFVLAALLRRGDVVEVRSWSLLMIAPPILMVAATLWALILPMWIVMQGVRRVVP